MQSSQSNNDIIFKVLVLLAAVPILIFLIIVALPLMLIIVVAFLCFLYFAKRKYKNTAHFKYINKKFVFKNQQTSNADETRPSETVIDAKYKSLEDENQNNRQDS